MVLGHRPAAGEFGHGDEGFCGVETAGANGQGGELGVGGFGPGVA
jgi:hypothetical protein